MIKIVSRPVNDDSFSFGLFNKLLSQLDCKYDAYHIWTNPPHKFEKFLNKTDFGRVPNVILAIKDGLDMWQEYNYWHDSAQAGIRLLDSTAARFPNTKFVVLTSLENFHKEKTSSPNLQAIPWGGDLTNQLAQYQDLEPVMDKNFDSQRTFIALNRNKRDHRIMILSYLFGSRLDKYGNITFLQCRPDNFRKDYLEESFWEFDVPRHDHFREKILWGYQRMLKNSRRLVGDYEIYTEDNNDNITNFNSKLRSVYRDSYVEIVTETSFCSPAYHLTEKTWHAFSGCNFPIFLFGQGGVQHLRELGFDVFDDVVCHAHDTVSNPIDRIVMALEMNRGLLTNADQVKDLWQTHKHRFLENIEVSKTWGSRYQERALDQWSSIKWNC